MNREYGVEEDDFGESPALENPVNMPARPASEKRFKWPTILVLLFLLAVLGGLVWQMSSAPEAPEPVVPTAQEPPLVEEALPEPELPEEPVESLEAPEPEPPEAETIQPQEPAAAPNATAPETDLDDAMVEAEPPSPDQRPEPEAAPEEDPNQEQPEPEARTEAEPAAVEAGIQSVVITARELCWIYGQVDNATVTDFTLRPGQSRRIEFDENLLLKLGNAGGVDITFNGSEYPLEAESGEVRTLVFP
jgi:cytoskeleton protein RodZ